MTPAFIHIIFDHKLQKMCGRVFQSLPLLRLLQIARTNKCSNAQRHSSSYNVCPTTYIPVIKTNRFYIDQKGEQQIKDQQLNNEESRELQYMKWGHQSKHNFVINGRIQEMLDKRMFVNIINNRCVVIIEGYFQWNQKKQPFSLRPKEGDHFLVAGLYTEDNQIIILTKDATPELAKVHNRMPVILSHQQVNLWMNPKNTKDIQKIIQQSLLKKDKEIWKNVGFAKIAPYVSKINEKGVKCLMTFEDYKKQLDKTGLMRFWKKAPAVQAVGVNGQVIKQGSSATSEPSVPTVKLDITQQVQEDKNSKLIPQKEQEKQKIHEEVQKKQ